MKKKEKLQTIPPAFIINIVQSVQARILNFANRLSPPFVHILNLAAGTMNTQIIYAAAKLGIADLLKDGPKSVDDLAKETDCNPDAIYRLLRALSSIGIFKEFSVGIFKITSSAEVLLRDHQMSVYPFALLVGDPLWREPWGDIMYSLKT
jgi:hypothetical protein